MNLNIYTKIQDITNISKLFENEKMRYNVGKYEIVINDFNKCRPCNVKGSISKVKMTLTQEVLIVKLIIGQEKVLFTTLFLSHV